VLIGPVFTRELVTAPRRARFYAFPAVYVGGLLVLTATAWMLLIGTQEVRNVGDMARFGSSLFQFLAPLQLVMSAFFAALIAASAVAQEKERRTFILLLLTSLSNSELVLGKLLASLLSVLLLLAAGLPFFMLTALFGGISFEQIWRVFAVTLVCALAAGSLGSTIALWREKTFQTLALTAMTLGALAAWEVALASGVIHGQWQGVPLARWAAGFSPWQALLAAGRPYGAIGSALPGVGSTFHLFLIVACAFTFVVNAIAVAMVRVWNPSREARPRSEETDEFRTAESVGTNLEPSPSGRGQGEGAVAGSGALLLKARGEQGALTPALSRKERENALHPHPGPLPGEERAKPTSLPGEEGAKPSSLSGGEGVRSVHAARGETKQVWNNPILWREVCTWAYGRKVLAIRLFYLAIVAAAVWSLHVGKQTNGVAGNSVVWTVAPMFVLSLVLINALSVISITTERDLGSLDLLLVTDIKPQEFILGKLAGVCYVAKEILLLPLALCVLLWWFGGLSLEYLVYVVLGLIVMDLFVATLGIHVGLAYTNTRTAVAVSLGTVFFLFIGVAACMRIMASFSNSFELQLAPFLALMIGGSTGLFVALGARNPSPAIGLSSFLLPAITFIAITGYLNNESLGVFLKLAFIYGLTTAAMLVPAISEFDVATGRTTE
jgi:ABC-type Na+ efflux pump permease subunit